MEISFVRRRSGGKPCAQSISNHDGSLANAADAA
jgi:hypothetical protein